MKALDMCAGIGLPACARFRERVFMRHAWAANALAYRYVRINRRYGYVAANRFLLSVRDSLQIGGTGLLADMSDNHFIEYAKVKSARSASQIMGAGSLGVGSFSRSGMAIEAAKQICKKAGFEYPVDIKPCDDEQTRNKKHIAAMARVMCDKWWRRQVRRAAARIVEQYARSLGLVSRKLGLYVSDFTIRRRQDQKKRNSEILKNLIATNEEGFSLTLEEAGEVGVSNPVNRFNELMVRIRGYDEIAKALGMDGVFITLTAPSKYHAVNSNGSKNGKYEGATPRQTQDYLNGVWSRVRAEWARCDIQVFGFRFVEPHHDGTPHWHQWLFVSKERRVEAMQIFENYACEHECEELVLSTDPRFKVVLIDPSVGSAAGYVVKYISKNINGVGVGADYESNMQLTDSQETAKRVEAWASTWGIRQFQQLGSVSVTVWREVRRAKDVINALADKELLLKVSAACESQDWQKFVELMGGVFVKRKDMLLRPLMVLTDKENNYGEFYKRIRGVIMRGAYKVVSRVHEWVISKSVERKASFEYSDEQKAVLQEKARSLARSGFGFDCEVGGLSPALGLV